MVKPPKTPKPRRASPKKTKKYVPADDFTDEEIVDKINQICQAIALEVAADWRMPNPKVVNAVGRVRVAIEEMEPDEIRKLKIEVNRLFNEYLKD